MNFEKKKILNFSFSGLDEICLNSSFNILLNCNKKVGERLAELIEVLVSYGMNLKDLTLVGHSLGNVNSLSKQKFSQDLK